MPSATDGFPMLTLNKRAYVFGGNIRMAVYAFEPTTSLWTTLAPMPAGLLLHRAVATVVDKSVLVCGGLALDSPAQSACYTYTVGADVWTQAAHMNTARYAHGMSVYKGMPDRVAFLNADNVHVLQVVCSCTVVGMRTTRIYRRWRRIRRTTLGTHCQRPCLRRTHILHLYNCRDYFHTLQLKM
jgi:hypothetical protein